MGTPDFAVPALEQLHKEFGVRAVVSVPDKQQGRGLHLQPSAVSVAADALGITNVLKPASLKDPVFAQQLAELEPDIICVIAFRILPASVYQLARTGAFNVHASLLPKYRGAAPINWAIINGEKETGVTSFLLNDVVDTGTVLLQRRVAIADSTTAGDLYAMLKEQAAECAVETCRQLISGTAQPIIQDNTAATSAPKVFRESSQINWEQPRLQVRNYIHGLSPTPCAWTMFNNETLKVFRVEFSSDSNSSAVSGTFRIVDSQFLVSCADGELSLTEFQIPGKRKMNGVDFIKGYRGPMQGKLA